MDKYEVMSTPNRKRNRPQMMTCLRCFERDYSIYVSGCPDCGEGRVAAAERTGRKPADLVPNVDLRGGDFTPNTLCRECCPTGHGTR